MEGSSGASVSDFMNVIRWLAHEFCAGHSQDEVRGPYAGTPSTPSFDHLVGIATVTSGSPGQRLRGFWIDERLKLGRSLLRSPPHVVGFHAAGSGRISDLQFIP
jgi:hypothetical protein